MFILTVKRIAHLIGCFDSTSSIHTKPILVPEWTSSKQIDLVVLEKRVGDEFAESGMKGFVEVFYSLIRAMR